jgi:putative Mn2+ efflux pump MntP
MLRLILLGVLAGLDNVQVAAAISVAPLPLVRRVLLAISFAVCEISSPVLGVFLAHEVQTRFHVSFTGIGPIVVALCGVVIVWLAFRDRDEVRPLLNSRWTLIGLPVSLSFDNLLIGFSSASLGARPALAALVIGSTSALLCIAGVAAGTRIARWIPERAELVSGCALIVIAASMWIRG